MGHVLIIAEKPNVMSKIRYALGNNPKFQNGYYLDDHFIFTSAIGHLYRLKYPNEMDEKYKFWKLDNLPFFFNKIPLVSSSEAVKQIHILKDAFKNKDITEIVNACDSDREGELIFREMLEGLGIKPNKYKITRLWITATTKDALEHAFKHRKLDTEYENVYLSAKGRAYADYLIGLNATEIMTLKYKQTLSTKVVSIGRVQTPTLRMIVDRDEAIKNFKSKRTYNILGSFISPDGELFNATYVNPKDGFKPFAYDAESAVDEAIKKIPITSYKVGEVKHIKKSSHHKALFSLSDLQIEASKIYGYGASVVLKACQSLYETHSLTTYPRTDENHITSDWASVIERFVLNSLPTVFNPIVKAIKTRGYALNHDVITSDNKVGAHEALTATNNKNADAEYHKLNEVESNVYKLIVCRMLSAFFPDSTSEDIITLLTHNDFTFKYSYNNVLTQGYKAVENFFKKSVTKEDNPHLLLLPKLLVPLKELTKKQIDTKAPPAFTEGTLIGAMKNPAKFTSLDATDSKIIKDIDGIGTEATRAGIIETLKSRGYITLSNKKIHATEAGTRLIHILPNDDLKSVSLTADMEKKLSAISDGSYTFDSFLSYIQAFTCKFITDINSLG